MKARLDTAKVLHFFDEGSNIAGGTFVAKVVDSDDKKVAELSMTQVVATPALYLSEAFSLSIGGRFDVFFEYEGTVVHRGVLDVGQPQSDAALDTAIIESFPAIEAGGIEETITLHVLDSEGATYIQEGEQDPIQASYDAAYNGYTAEVTFEAEGDYFLVWAKDQVPIAAKNIFAIKPYGLENIRLFCNTLQGNNGTPHIDTTAIISTTGGTQVAFGITDVEGMLDLQVPPNKYVISLIKAGTTFGTNNFEINVGNSLAEGLGEAGGAVERQTYHLLTASFNPTTSDPQDKASMCTLFASVYKMDGTPLSHAPVHVRMLTKPQLYSGTTVYDSQLSFATDSNGKVTFELIQGIEVEVAIPPMGVRRKIKVPSGEDASEPANLFELLSEANDLFDIQKPQVQTAPRRTR